MLGGGTRPQQADLQQPLSAALLPSGPLEAAHPLRLECWSDDKAVAEGATAGTAGAPGIRGDAVGTSSPLRHGVLVWELGAES